MLRRLVYTGDFIWKGTRYAGSHEPLITRARFEDVHAVLRGKPRSSYPKQRHAFIGLLTCARCGCSLTAEMKKGKYVYYRCSGYHGRCGNDYVRQERLAQLLGEVIRPIQISQEVADGIATALRASDQDAEGRRSEDLRQLDQRRRTIVSKLDRGYDDLVEGRISEEFWTRKAQQWEAELAAADAERPRLERPRALASATAEKILELAKQAGIRSNSGDCSKRCYRTAPSIAKVFALLTVSHSTCSSAATKQEIGGVDGTRTRGLRRDRPFWHTDASKVSAFYTATYITKVILYR